MPSQEDNYNKAKYIFTYVSHLPVVKELIIGNNA